MKKLLRKLSKDEQITKENIRLGDVIDNSLGNIFYVYAINEDTVSLSLVREHSSISPAGSTMKNQAAHWPYVTTKCRRLYNLTDIHKDI